MRGNPYHDERGRFCSGRADRIRQYANELIEEEKRRTRPEFRDEVTLSDAIGHDMMNDLMCIGESSDDERRELKEKYLRLSKEYAAEWYDEDWGEYRSGNEWEANFYKKLAELCD